MDLLKFLHIAITQGKRASGPTVLCRLDKIKKLRSDFNDEIQVRRYIYKNSGCNSYHFLCEIEV